MNTRRRRWAKAHREIRRRGGEVLVAHLQERALTRLQFLSTHFNRAFAFGVKSGRWSVTMWSDR